MKGIAFTDQARSDVRALDRPTAMRIFAALHRFAETGAGDVKRLQGHADELPSAGRLDHWRGLPPLSPAFTPWTLI